MIFGLTFLKYSLRGADYSEENISHFIQSYIISGLFIQVALCMASISIGKIISSRIAGPIAGIKRYLKDTLEGKSYPFRLREKDHFKELEWPLTEVNQKIAGLENKEDEAA